MRMENKINAMHSVYRVQVGHKLVDDETIYRLIDIRGHDTLGYIASSEEWFTATDKFQPEFYEVKFQTSIHKTIMDALIDAIPSAVQEAESSGFIVDVELHNGIVAHPCFRIPKVESEPAALPPQRNAKFSMGDNVGYTGERYKKFAGVVESVTLPTEGDASYFGDSFDFDPTYTIRSSDHTYSDIIESDLEMVAKPIVLNPDFFEIHDGYVGHFGKEFKPATQDALNDAVEKAMVRNGKTNLEIINMLLDGEPVQWCDSPNHYYDHGVGIIRKKRAIKHVELIKCSCGHSVPQSQVMNASLGTSCPDCYDKMSG